MHKRYDDLSCGGTGEPTRSMRPPPPAHTTVIGMTDFGERKIYRYTNRFEILQANGIHGLGDLGPEFYGLRWFALVNCRFEVSPAPASYLTLAEAAGKGTL